ncbi:MAG TPA: phosphotransferase [Conexibacter sp.]|nr:phosphotransferase [Conexibacter sp.]
MSDRPPRRPVLRSQEEARAGRFVEDRELAAALERGLPTPVRILARRESPYASSFPLAELDVEAGDGARMTVVWKDLTPSSLLPGARAARGGRAISDPTRELRAYELLDGADLGTPRRIAAVEEPDRVWLFLEAVRGARLEHVGDLATWAAVARWLAGAHTELTARVDALPVAGDAPDAPAWPPASVLTDPTTLLVRTAERGDPPQRLRRVEALAGPLELAAARAATAPPTVIHGELYAANVLIESGPPAHPPTTRVCVLDWETIARGPALLDLAALTAGGWDLPGDPLAEAYRDALPDPPMLDAFQADLDAARLLTAAHWLAPPAGWTPPPEQARDWLCDAEAIVGRLQA